MGGRVQHIDNDSLTPHGVSGLKSGHRSTRSAADRSHPTRGEWIEMPPPATVNSMRRSHPTRGEWIEMASTASAASTLISLTPHGVSGLKFLLAHLAGG